MVVDVAIKEAPLQLQFSPDSSILLYGTYSSELKSLKIDDDSEKLVAGPTLQAKEKTRENRQKQRKQEENYQDFP